MKKRTPEEILKQLEKPASSWGRPAAGGESTGDRDMDAVLAMTDEEVSAGLEADGVDLKALSAMAAAIAAKTEAVPAKAEATAESKAPEAAGPDKLAKVVPLRPRLARWMKWGPVAIAAGTGGVVGLSQLLHMAEPLTEVASGRDAAPETPNERAARELREDARAACQRKEWVACLQRLDRAAGLDPEGDKDDLARGLRRLASEGVSEAGGTE